MRTIAGITFGTGTAQFPDPRGWPGGPTLSDVVMANLEKAEALGSQLHFSTTSIQPVMDGRRVAGIIAQAADGTYRRYLARKGVLLAAGGFSGNREMLEDLVTDIPDLLRDDQELPKFPGWKGLGHQIGVWAGGRLEPRPLPVMGGQLCYCIRFYDLWNPLAGPGGTALLQRDLWRSGIGLSTGYTDAAGDLLQYF